MIDSGSRSQVRPLECFKRSRFGLLAIASFIIHNPDEEQPLGNATPNPRMQIGLWPITAFIKHNNQSGGLCREANQL
jgi:hypothetical protein